MSKRLTASTRFVSSVALVAFLLLGSTGRASAASIIYVKYNATGANNGSSWANAYKSLQKALNLAVSGQQIWVAKGTYKPTLRTNPMDARSVTFFLKDGVAIYGGFAGTETLLSQRNWKTNATILSGEIGAAGTADNAYNVVVAGEIGKTTILDGFTITAGRADGISDDHGGGIENISSTPTLRNLKIISNYAAGFGGGMYNGGASPALTNVALVNNVSAYGGGMYSDTSSPTITNVAFTGNTAEYIGGNYGRGGGMMDFNSSPKLSHVTFTGNQAGSGLVFGWGGGMYNDSSSPTLSNVMFSSNTTTAAGGGIDNENSSSPILTAVTFAGNSGRYGGGIDNASGSSSPKLTNVTFKSNSALAGGGMYDSSSATNPTLSHVAFNGNSATIEGGGLLNFDSSPSLTNVSFTGNTVSGQGGGLYNTVGAAPTLTNVAFSANSATGASGAGGGVYNYQSSPTLTNATFSGNSAGHEGGGMFNDTNSSPTLNSTTFSGNSAVASGGGMYNYSGSSPTFWNTTFSSNTAGSGAGIFDELNSSPTLRNATFSGNSASFSAGAIINENGSSPQLYNGIFWADSPSEIGNFFAGSTPYIADDIVQGGCPPSSSCTNALNADPQLGLLKNNGGFSKTMALGAGSAAIDAGGANSTCASIDQRGVPRPQGPACDMGAYEVRVITFTSQATYDGWVLESGKGTNVGGSLNAAGTTLLAGDNSLNRRYRDILSFNTAALPDAAALVRANLQVRQQSTSSDPFSTQGSLVADLAKPYFGSELGLVISDWQAAATAPSAASFGGTLLPNGAWYAASLSSAARAAVNKLGTTQFRLRFTSDMYNSAAEYLALYSGNALIAANRPRLIVYYNP